MKELINEVTDMKSEIKDVREEHKSYAMELTQAFKEQANRWFFCWLVTFLAFIGLLTYTIWLMNDITTVELENTQEITDVQTIENSTITNGD